MPRAGGRPLFWLFGPLVGCANRATWPPVPVPKGQGFAVPALWPHGPARVGWSLQFSFIKRKRLPEEPFGA